MPRHETHIRFARDTTSWLLSEFARRLRASPGEPASEILTSLAERRIGCGNKRISPTLGAQRIEGEPYLLETAIYILTKQGLWPSDPETALICCREALSTILETAPTYGLPWKVTARVATA